MGETEDHKLDRLAVEAALEAAEVLTGVVCRTSAALLWGWSLKVRPARPVIAVDRRRRIRPERAVGIEVVRPRLPVTHVDGLVTSRARTVLDCMVTLPFDAGLAVADSALRTGFAPEDLVAVAGDFRGPGAVKARQVARQADGRSANAFESVLRSICLTVPGLNVTPQVDLGDAGEFIGRPDLVDLDLRILIEADSFAHHSRRSDLRRDVHKTTAFSVDGWVVLRFSFEDVMHRPDYVREMLVRAVARRTNCAA